MVQVNGDEEEEQRGDHPADDFEGRLMLGHGDQTADEEDHVDGYRNQVKEVVPLQLAGHIFSPWSWLSVNGSFGSDLAPDCFQSGDTWQNRENLMVRRV